MLKLSHNDKTFQMKCVGAQDATQIVIVKAGLQQGIVNATLELWPSTASLGVALWGQLQQRRRQQRRRQQHRRLRLLQQNAPPRCQLQVETSGKKPVKLTWTWSILCRI